MIPLHIRGGSSTFRCNFMEICSVSLANDCIACQQHHSVKTTLCTNRWEYDMCLCCSVMFRGKKTLHILSSLIIPYVLFNEKCLKVVLRIEVRFY